MDSPGPSEHDYRECADEGCPAALCRIYKEGRHSGYAAGYVSGEAEGYAAGYNAGEADGRSAR
jgi:flagellar biosynthesis/type III secretory pathway protein FliH